MKTRAVVWFCAAFLGLNGLAFGGSELSIRLVEASGGGKGVSKALRDVADLLRANIPGADTFQVVADKTIPLPANGTVAMTPTLSVQCSGRQASLNV